MAGGNFSKLMDLRREVEKEDLSAEEAAALFYKKFPHLVSKSIYQVVTDYFGISIECEKGDVAAYTYREDEDAEQPLPISVKEDKYNSEAQKRFLIGHEFGHKVSPLDTKRKVNMEIAHSDKYLKSKRKHKDDVEAWANKFSAAILMPREQVLEALGTHDFHELARMLPEAGGNSLTRRICNLVTIPLSAYIFNLNGEISDDNLIKAFPKDFNHYHSAKTHYALFEFHKDFYNSYKEFKGKNSNPLVPHKNKPMLSDFGGDFQDYERALERWEKKQFAEPWPVIYQILSDYSDGRKHDVISSQTVKLAVDTYKNFIVVFACPKNWAGELGFFKPATDRLF